jgi:hypothetical protein
MAGNSNSGSHKDRLFRNAVMIELKVRDAGEDMRTLRRIAGGIIDDALAGDKDARNMVADRIDGKPMQQQQIDITETKTVIRAPSQEASTAIWARQLQKTESNTTLSGNLSKGHKLNS